MENYFHEDHERGLALLQRNQNWGSLTCTGFGNN